MSDLDLLLAEAEERPVEGWDFGWLGDRLAVAGSPRHGNRRRRMARSACHATLDDGRDGGLAAERSRWPARGLCRSASRSSRSRRLPTTSTSGRTKTLSFEDDGFSLVVNRHESFVAGEVARILCAGGIFLTQQVGGEYVDFHELLGLERPEPSAWTRVLACDQLESAGVRVVDGAEGAEEVSFGDAGALAWYLKAIPWVAEGFSIADFRTQLKRLHGRTPVTARQPAFWLKAVKP